LSQMRFCEAGEAEKGMTFKKDFLGQVFIRVLPIKTNKDSDFSGKKGLPQMRKQEGKTRLMR
jgi:hypothetical protein